MRTWPFWTTSEATRVWKDSPGWLSEVERRPIRRTRMLVPSPSSPWGSGAGCTMSPSGSAISERRSDPAGEGYQPGATCTMPSSVPSPWDGGGSVSAARWPEREHWLEPGHSHWERSQPRRAEVQAGLGVVTGRWLGLRHSFRRRRSDGAVRRRVGRTLVPIRLVRLLRSRVRPPSRPAMCTQIHSRESPVSS